VVQLLGAVLIYGYFVVAAAFRSAGDTRTPFYLLGGSVLFNLLLDPLMILGWGPIPALGVYGAALATVLTRGWGSWWVWCCSGTGAGSARGSTPASRGRSSALGFPPCSPACSSA
jgi:Na+-driven multidrug efflux pump